MLSLTPNYSYLLTVPEVYDHCKAQARIATRPQLLHLGNAYVQDRLHLIDRSLRPQFVQFPLNERRSPVLSSVEDLTFLLNLLGAGIAAGLGEVDRLSWDVYRAWPHKVPRIAASAVILRQTAYRWNSFLSCPFLLDGALLPVLEEHPVSAALYLQGSQ